MAENIAHSREIENKWHGLNKDFFFSRSNSYTEYGYDLLFGLVISASLLNANKSAFMISFKAKCYLD